MIYDFSSTASLFAPGCVASYSTRVCLFWSMVMAMAVAMAVVVAMAVAMAVVVAMAVMWR